MLEAILGGFVAGVLVGILFLIFDLNSSASTAKELRGLQNKLLSLKQRRKEIEEEKNEKKRQHREAAFDASLDSVIQQFNDVRKRRK